MLTKLIHLRDSGMAEGQFYWLAKEQLDGLLVSADKTFTLIKLLDPEGVEQRHVRCLRRRHYHSKGYNALWHMDGTII